MSRDDEERRIGRAVTGGDQRRPELEIEAGDAKLARIADKDRLVKAKDQAADRMSGMVGIAMDALQLALMSEDESLRLKAVGMVLDRLVPRVKAVGGEEDAEVVNIPESRKTLLADVEEEIRKGRAAGQ